MLLQDVWFLEKLAHFDREVIPERRMHAKGCLLYTSMDNSLGDLMDYLKELGVANRTLVIFMSANGGDAPIPQSYSGDIPWLEKISAVAPLRGRKGSRYEGGTRIPMIVGWAEVDSSSPCLLYTSRGV